MIKWAVIENNEITNIFEGSNPPPGSVQIPAEMNPFELSWDGENLISSPIVLTEEQIAAGVRFLRDDKLKSSDWTQLPDVPLATKEAWATYRQTLRDLPTHANWPNLADEDWPIQP